MIAMTVRAAHALSSDMFIDQLPIDVFREEVQIAAKVMANADAVGQSEDIVPKVSRRQS